MEERASFPQLRLEVAPLAYQVLALMVSRDVWISGVRALSREQLRQIYEGEITNWKQIGGADQPIKFFNPEAGHGVWETFATWLYGDPRKADPGDKFQRVGTGEETRNVVEFSAGALSVVSPLRVDQSGTYALAIKSEKGELVQPTLEAARAGTYPLSRRFDMVTPNRPHGEVRKVIEFMQSADGQQILRQSDLVPAEGK
jgi:phosphate transport system substrate-binding protein